MSNKYPQWIDEYAKAFHNGFMNMVPTSWGPVDGLALTSYLNGTFLDKLHKAIEKIHSKKYPIAEVAKTFSCPSTLRVAFYLLIWEYQNSEPKDKIKFKEIAEFIVKVIETMTKKDTFAYDSNIIHSKDEINQIIKNTDWVEADAKRAREIGKLYNSLSALVFALYRDFFPQDSHEIYGPYSVADNFGDSAILLIKHFPKIRPVDLWSETKSFKYSDVKIYQIFKNVKFKCDIIGMHSIYEGDLINNLIKYAVIVDGKVKNDIEDIKSLSDYFAEIATEKSTIYDNLTKEELAKKFLEWECYQFFNFFRLAEMDWRPTEQMLESVRSKDIPDRLEIKEFPAFKDYVASPEFEIFWLKDLYK